MSRLAHNPPAESPQPSLRLSALEDAVRAADPAALLVSPRVLRRIIKQATGVSGFGLRVPHRKTFVIAREELLAIVDRLDLDLPSDAELPDSVILIARPSSDVLLDSSAAEITTKFGRQLFHARVHQVLEQAIAEGRLTAADLQARIQHIGESEFEEIRTVLRQEDYLLPPQDDLRVYVEFAAVYLELRHFVPGFLRSYFPSLEDLHAIDELLKRDVDAEALLAATRLPGAPETHEIAEVPRREGFFVAERIDDPQPTIGPRRLPSRQRSQRVALALLARADQVSGLGNLVRSAILRTRAAHYAQSDQAHRYREQARAEVGRLARRLQAALNFSDSEAAEWTRSLASLLEQAASGAWTAEARMLYDLQKVCVDHERGIFALDVGGWLLSLGRQPLKRPLPGQRDVMISKHLRSAAHRLPSAKLTHRARSRLAALVQSAVHRAETALRARFKPLVDRALDRVKLLPQNPPERVARKKLVDEILDRVVDRGFFSMGDFRDALSRNNLKLPDLASAAQFARGDQLLQADRQLAAGLDGVYRGGEIYRRLPQRLSSLAFGTPPGRFFTRYIAMPFGGAYLMLKGVEEILVITVPSLHEKVKVVASTPFILAVGCILLGLLYHQRFRALCIGGLNIVGRAARRTLVDFPRWLAGLEAIQRIMRSWHFQLFKRYVFKPLVLAAFATGTIVVLSGEEASWQTGLAIFLVVNLALNSRLGRNVDEMVTDWVVTTWHRLRIHVFMTLFRMIMELFNRIVETIERLLYTVDEWLRFRAGEQRSTTVVKACLAAVWFFVNYVIRFCVNLMIEPQVNPIKHFPVVTVSHKFILPAIIMLQRTLEGPLGIAWAWGLAVFAQLLFPGIFGFLVWELKENWRLYAANRPRDLQPIAIGHHGETMIRLLRPGFHSGTVPRLYARLRRAARKAYWTRNWKTYAKHNEGLHHVTEGIRRFVDRDLCELLHESRSWDDRSITTGEIHLGCNRILIELYCPELAEESLWVAFEEQSGWLVASLHRRGWADSLSPQRRHTLGSALAGFYKMAGVDLVREQIATRLDVAAGGYCVNDTDLVVWHRDGPRRAVPLRSWTVDAQPGFATEALAARQQWVFAASPITWRRWVVNWELDALGDSGQPPLVENMELLPV
jgi:hypothetical protein